MENKKYYYFKSIRLDEADHNLYKNVVKATGLTSFSQIIRYALKIYLKYVEAGGPINGEN